MPHNKNALLTRFLSWWLFARHAEETSKSLTAERDPMARSDLEVDRQVGQSLLRRGSLPSGGVRRFLSLALLASALLLIYFVCSRRVVDFSDEGFYYTSAWLAYSPEGGTSVARLLMNFGYIIGIPYLVTSHPTILEFRLVSMVGWYVVHYWFFSSFARKMSIAVSSWLLHLLCIFSLFIFLIPVLSYQNLPFLFALATTAATLEATTRGRWSGISGASIPIFLSAGVVSSTVFSVFVFPAAVVVAAYLRRDRWWSSGWLLIGMVGAALLCAVVFKPETLAQSAHALEFFNSEVNYTDAWRITDKAIALAGLIGPLLLVGLAGYLAERLLKGSFIWAEFGILLATTAGIAAFSTYGLVEQCSVTCDSSVMALVRIGLLCVVPIVFMLRRSIDERALIALVALPVGTEFFITSISNAPFQYNLKFAVPTLFGVLIILISSEAGRMRSWLLACLCAALVLAGGTSLRVLLLSHYGGTSIWRSTLPLPDKVFAGLYADPARVRLIERMTRAYRELGCADRFFAAVDSLALPYFLFGRRPPFPHAWVARRVPMSRDSVSRQGAGCVMMQDRVLPNTPPDAATMKGYLRIGPQDESEVVSLGENIYLLAFRRKNGPGSP